MNKDQAFRIGVAFSMGRASVGLAFDARYTGGDPVQFISVSRPNSLKKQVIAVKIVNGVATGASGWAKGRKFPNAKVLTLEDLKRKDSLKFHHESARKPAGTLSPQEIRDLANFESTRFPNKPTNWSSVKKFVATNIKSLTNQNARSKVQACVKLMEGYTTLTIDGKKHKIFFGKNAVDECLKGFFGRRKGSIGLSEKELARRLLTVFANFDQFSTATHGSDSAWKQIIQEGVPHHPRAEFLTRTIVFTSGGDRFKVSLDIAREAGKKDGRKIGYQFNVEGLKNFANKSVYLPKLRYHPNGMGKDQAQDQVQKLYRYFVLGLQIL